MNKLQRGHLPHINKEDMNYDCSMNDSDSNIFSIHSKHCNSLHSEFTKWCACCNHIASHSTFQTRVPYCIQCCVSETGSDRRVTTCARRTGRTPVHSSSTTSAKTPWVPSSKFTSEIQSVYVSCTDIIRLIFSCECMTSNFVF